MDGSGIVGAWELVTSERRDADGTVVGEALPGYTGQLIYSAGGHMSAHLMGPDRPILPTASRPAWPVEQKARAFDTYIGYFGPYTINEAAGVVTHHVRGASLPAMVGTEQVRAFQLSGDQLVLSPPPREGSTERSFIIWRRVQAR